MARQSKQYVFGPVPSRRLGRSLGIDLVPYKTCTYNCAYCQIGKTTKRTLEQSQFVPRDEVLRQLEARLSEAPVPDTITLSGSGEPTLYLGLGEIIREIKNISSIPVAVLTNGSLLGLPEVREALLFADIVAPDLDAGSARVFRAVNRPHPKLRFKEIVEGLVDFSRQYRGTLLLEVFIVAGKNDGEDEVKRMAKIIDRVECTRVQINTVTRPPAEAGAGRVARERLLELSMLFGPRAEVIADFKPLDMGSASSAGRTEIMEMLARRPCTLEDITAGLGIGRENALKCVGALISERKIIAAIQNEMIYYLISGAGG